ncbi:hypothetical protein V7x_43330 [Crateriforma conspicua]|uniref:DUF1565 domain-containing protein n=1 Tax=Crateriforma conspicua TaxID=2527996 RepID=A0A5C6FPM4_9PLAN|nr:hypothetical protein V7x_43330 [Crateriforma conspicua]
MKTPVPHALVVSILLTFASVLPADDFAHRSAPAPLKFISFDVPRAYPGLPYCTRMAVIGGEWPYRFELVKSPECARITDDRGDVLWTPKKEGDEGTFEVKVADRAGKSISKAWSVKVTKSGFYFVSPTGDDEKGDGTVEHPWKTVQLAINRAKGTGTIYLRKGGYRERSRAKGAPGGFDKNTLLIGKSGYFQHRKATRENPFVLSGYPGEKVTIMPAEEEMGGIAAWTPCAHREPGDHGNLAKGRLDGRLRGGPRMRDQQGSGRIQQLSGRVGWQGRPRVRRPRFSPPRRAPAAPAHARERDDTLSRQGRAHRRQPRA